MKVFDAKRRGGIVIYPEGREVFHDKVIPSKRTAAPKCVLVRVTQSPSFEGMESLIYAPGSLYRPHIVIDRDGEFHQYIFLGHEGVCMAAAGYVIVDVISSGIFEECRDGVIRSRLTQDPYEADVDGPLYEFDDSGALYALINKAQVSSLITLRLALQRWKEGPFQFLPFPDNGVSQKCVGFDRNIYLSESKLNITEDGPITGRRAPTSAFPNQPSS